MQQLLVAVIFHLVPLVPLFFGRGYLAVGLALVVVSAYVKDRKLTILIDTLEAAVAANGGRLDPKLGRELEEMRKARDRWRYLRLPLPSPRR